MRFSEFEQLARAEWERIPDRFKGGIDALVVERDARPHPGRSGVWTLGECVTETYPSDFGGPDTTRSAVVLYYGSFRRLADQEDDFPWQQEIWETLTHELRHHLESLAAEDALDNMDVAVEENFKRTDGEPFDPFFYRLGEELADGWYRVEESWFLERPLPEGGDISFEWEGKNWRVNVPATDADVLFLDIDGVDDPPYELCLVLLRQRRLGARLRAALKGGWRVDQRQAVAVPT